MEFLEQRRQRGWERLAVRRRERRRRRRPAAALARVSRAGDRGVRTRGEALARGRLVHVVQEEVEAREASAARLGVLLLECGERLERRRDAERCSGRGRRPRLLGRRAARIERAADQATERLPVLEAVPTEEGDVGRVCVRQAPAPLEHLRLEPVRLLSVVAQCGRAVGRREQCARLRVGRLAAEDLEVEVEVAGGAQLALAGRAA